MKHSKTSKSTTACPTALGSLSLLRNKQLLRESGSKAFSRVGNTPTLQDCVVNKEFSSSEIPAYKSKRLHDHCLLWAPSPSEVLSGPLVSLELLHVEFTTWLRQTVWSRGGSSPSVMVEWKTPLAWHGPCEAVNLQTPCGRGHEEFSTS